MNFKNELKKLFETSPSELLENKIVGVVGVGALGSFSSMILSKLPLKKLIIIDRDVVEEKNLFRQLFYDLEDCKGRIPKVFALKDKIESKGGCEVEARDINLDGDECFELFEECDVVIDGTDNFETRFLLNDASAKFKKPFIYGGVIGMKGSLFFVDSESGACLRCLFQEPEIGVGDTCETVGIFPSLPAIIASMQAVECTKYLLGKKDEVVRDFITMDLKENSFVKIKVEKDRNCQCCGRKIYKFLENENKGEILCGRDTLMVKLQKERFDYENLKNKFREDKSFFENEYLFEFESEGYKFSIHKDGRVFLNKIDDIKKGFSIVSRVLGF